MATFFRAWPVGDAAHGVPFASIRKRHHPGQGRILQPDRGGLQAGQTVTIDEKRFRALGEAFRAARAEIDALAENLELVDRIERGLHSLALEFEREKISFGNYVPALEPKARRIELIERARLEARAPKKAGHDFDDTADPRVKALRQGRQTQMIMQRYQEATRRLVRGMQPMGPIAWRGPRHT